MKKLATARCPTVWVLFALLFFVQAASAGTVIISGNVNPITINDNTTATPYPSTATVSGATVNTLTKVQVKLQKFSHTFPKDVDVLLVGPQGQRCMLMSDAGGVGPGVSNVDLTFSSTAATVLPQNTAPATGSSYRPANYINDVAPADLNDTFVSPGPGTLTDQPADLTVFNLTNPNGVWSLYVVDDASPDTGSIASGWVLFITVPTVFTVNSTADTDDGVCDAANCTLREALNAAGNDDLINFSSLFNTPQTINLLTALPDITKSVTIQGPGANLLTVRRDYNAATNFRIFNIPGGVTNGVAISGMTISNGRGGNGPGGINSGSYLFLTNVNVIGNQADGGAGGVGIALAGGVFTGCTFSGNTAVAGAGIDYEGASGYVLRLINCTVSGNKAASGGGILNVSLSNSSQLEVTNCTIVNNTATQGGGIETLTQGSASLTATTTLRNSIIAGNTADNLIAGSVGGGTSTFITNGFNLSDNFNGVFTPAGTDITSATPRLAPLSLNGGKTPTHALLEGSPAINHGDASGLATDQRGVPRPASNADIGAVEMNFFTVINTNDDTNLGSLRSAITAANSSGDVIADILFLNGLFSTPQTITLATALPNITANLTINGPGANLLTVRRDPNNAAKFRIFNIPNGGLNIAISGMTITGGDAGSGTFGGGINSQSLLSLIGVHVTGNAAASGGGVDLAFADGVFANCTFSNNSSTAANGPGGGIAYQGNGGHTLRLVGSTVSGNHSASGGGGILNLSAGGNSRLEITNSTIANNTAVGSGGGIQTLTQSGASNTAMTTLRNTIVAGNSSDNLGIASGGGAATFTSFGFNLANDNGGGFLNVAPITTDKINAFAGLFPLSDNGGPVPTHALFGNSAALDAGNNSGSGTLFDQRGPNFLRTVDLPATNATGSDGTDIGAFEAQTTPLGLVANVSTRLPVGIGDGALIEGFTVLGPGGSIKKIIVRALGPSLVPLGISDALTNPTLDIFDSNNQKIASNDNWKTTQMGGIITADQFAEISGSGLAPSNDSESAIIANLSPGAYTGVVRGANNTVGTGLVDAFDLSAGSAARLANVATRGLIQPGDKLLIAGFIVQSSPVKVVVRAIGPSLTQFGINDALPDTTLELHDQNGAIVRQNDDWMSDQKAELQSTGLQPSNNLEAALVDTIAPGLYTAQVRGKPEQTGTGVVEIYFLQ